LQQQTGRFGTVSMPVLEVVVATLADEMSTPNGFTCSMAPSSMRRFMAECPIEAGDSRKEVQSIGRRAVG
jgi:hypothetical protein